MNFRIAAALAVAAVFAGCPSPADQLCQTQQECNQLTSGTVTQCETNSDNCVQQFMQGNASCQQFAQDYEAFASCGATLSCSDLEFQNVDSSGCSAQWEKWIKAIPSAAGCPSCEFGSGTDGGS